MDEGREGDEDEDDDEDGWYECRGRDVCLPVIK
jgi:hypothetical protein